MNRFKKFLILVIIFWMSALFCPSGEANITLSVNPVRGGSSLRFSRIDMSSEASQEVRVRITSDEESQYQVFQSIIEPLVNERGQRLDPSALQSYSLIGSNSLGTLYLQQISSMRQVDDLIYSSNRTGQSDSLVVVYTLDPKKINASGRFSGRVLYTVRPISGGSPKQVSLDIFVEATDNFKIETQGSSGKNLVKLESRQHVDREAYFKISFSGNNGELLTIYEEIERLPVNELNQEIHRESFLSFVTAPQDQDLIRRSEQSPFTARRPIYASNKMSDELAVHYLLNEDVISSEKAGVYRGQIKYVFEKPSVTQSVLLNIEITIHPVFEIQVHFPQGDPRFDNILPNSPPQIREAFVEVKTNLEKPYIVIQKNLAPLANEQGTIFKEEFFDMKVESLEGIGKNFFDDFKSVSKTEQSIFRSDAKGRPSRARILYRLRPYPGMEPGNYLTSIVYSLGEI